MKFLDKFKNGKSLLARAARGGAWMSIGSGAEQGMRFLRTLILARLLAREAFGQMAIVLSCCYLAQVITGLGIKEAVIQSPHGRERTYLNGAWFVAMFRGLVLYAAAFIVSPWAESFYSQPGLSLMLRIAFLAFLAQGAMSPRVYVAVKDTQYHKWVSVQNLGGIIGVLTTIILAFYIRGVWALVIGYVTESAARLVLSQVVCPFWPRANFDKEHLRALISYNRGIFGMPLLTLIYTQASVLVLGKLRSKSDLGLYTLTLSLATMPSSLLTDLIRSLLLPAFAEMQTNMERLNRCLFKVSWAIIGIGIPAITYVTLYGSNILQLAYGSRYAGSPIPFAVLFSNDILMLCNVPMVAIFLAVGRPSMLRLNGVIRAVVVALMVYPAIQYMGLLGAALTPLVGIAVSFGFQLQQARSVTSLQITRYLALIPRAVAFALPVFIGWLLAWTIIERGHGQGLPNHSGGFKTMLLGTVLTAVMYSIIGIIAMRHGQIRELLWPEATSRAEAAR